MEGQFWGDWDSVSHCALQSRFRAQKAQARSGDPSTATAGTSEEVKPKCWDWGISIHSGCQGKYGAWAGTSVGVLWSVGLWL